MVFSYISILKNDAFMSTGWDLGIYEQVIWSTTNTGRIFWYTLEIAVNPSCSFFGIHFSPILFLVVPIYAIYQSTETLLVLQALVLALAAIPLYKLALYESKSVKQALTFSSIYLVYPPIASMMTFDFHVQAFLPLFFFSAFYYFRKGKWARYFVFTVLALMVDEIVPLIVVFFGFYGLWINRKSLLHVADVFHPRRLSVNKSVVYSIATIVLGVAWFVLARTVTSAVNPTAPPNPNWSNLGNPTQNPLGFLFNVLTNPLKTVKTIVTPVAPKGKYLLGLFAPLFFLSFLSPPSLIIGAPWFIIAFLSNYAPYYTALGYQYVAFVAPFIFISAIYGVKRLGAVKNYLASSKRFKSVSSKITKFQYKKAMLIICLFFVITLPSFLSLSLYVAILNIHLPVVTKHDEALEVFVSLIPSNASVLTQNNLIPHVCTRLYVYGPSPNATGTFPANITFEYIFVDTTSTWYVPSLKNLINNVTKNGSFGIQYAYDGILLLKKGYIGKTIDPIGKGD
jgi:uncharacterized membrane protein